MAKKKSKSSGSSASALSRELAQISANATIQAQQIANQATIQSFEYNRQEAATARAFNKQEADITRAFNKQEADTTRAYNSYEAALNRNFNADEAKKARDFNASEAQKARNWEERMSNTSHQREVADLKKAGLNPVLSVNGGAQSYTTSSASANAASGSAASSSPSSANPASAMPASAYAYDASGTVGQLASSLIQGRIGEYQADESAKATRYAAKQSAAATKYAAAQQASAAKYAASLNYQNYRKHEAWQTEYMKEEYRQKKDVILNTPVNNVAALADKYLTKAKIADTIVSSKWMKGITKFFNGALNNPEKLFKDNVRAARNDYSKILTRNGVRKLNNYLNQVGLKQNRVNRNLLINSFIFGRPAAFSILLAKMPKRRYFSTLR